MNKTVYILGAGFSKEAGAPSQEGLINEIFAMSKEYPDDIEKKHINKFSSFLTETLRVPRNLQSYVPLEDVFTPLDKCIAENVSFRDLNTKEMLEMRELIHYLIGKSLQLKLRNTDKLYIDSFSAHLVDKCSIRKKGMYGKFDPVSVISTNWDILLDNSIKAEIRRKHPNKAVVDYCCHISSYRKGDQSVKPGLEMLGKGGFNVKLLKLHGSLNWLQCPRCHRLYVDFDNKIAISQYKLESNCRHCDNNFGHLPSHKLISNLIMPTFLKNLANPQYKLIWQNAGIELAEASKIVFIGYSLPMADFEMRQLLSRMVRENAKIEVVSYGNECDQHIKDLKQRYNVFFGKRNPKYFLNGAKDYILTNVD